VSKEGQLYCIPVSTICGATTDVVVTAEREQKLTTV